MKKAWKIVLIIVAALIIIGSLSIMAGLITGASTERMIDNLFGGREDMELVIRVLRQEFGNIFSLR